MFLGRELGARSEDESCYVNGVVQYDRLAKTTLFSNGIDRLLRGARDHNIALMCAERDPLTCHRTILSPMIKAGQMVRRYSIQPQ